MSILYFSTKKEAEEKAEELLNAFPSGFEYIVQKVLNREDYAIFSFLNQSTRLSVTFLEEKWYVRHMDFENVCGNGSCVMSAIKSARVELLKEIQSYEKELKKMNEASEQDWGA